MKDFIFITGTSGVGKSTLASGLLKHFNTTCIEQNIIPEFYSRDGIEEMTGELEELTCREGQKALLFSFNKLGYKNVVATDLDDLRTRDIPIDFYGYKFIIIKLVCSDLVQLKNQMKNRPNNGLIDYELQEKCNTKNLNRACLPNEFLIDINGMSEEQVLTKAIDLIENNTCLLEYEYIKPDKSQFYSWVFSNELR